VLVSHADEVKNSKIKKERHLYQGTKTTGKSTTLTTVTVCHVIETCVHFERRKRDDSPKISLNSCGAAGVWRCCSKGINCNSLFYDNSDYWVVNTKMQNGPTDDILVNCHGSLKSCKCQYLYFIVYLTDMWLNIYIHICIYIYICGIWAFSSSRKHLLITLLRLEFVVLVLYFSIYFYLCSFNYSLFFVVYFFVFFCL
jgi:hypothetical protein